MKDIDFTSNDKYILLPTIKNPKVYLLVENEFKMNSFKLYNPSSFLGKLLKEIAYNFPIFNIIKTEKSDFVNYIESYFKKEIHTSIYKATDKDKIVLQLQNKNEIVGYAKIGITSNGNKRIENEIYALEVLKDIVTINILWKSQFKKYNFFIINEIKGNIIQLDKTVIFDLLNKLKRNESFLLKDHPRYLKMLTEIKSHNNSNKYLKLLEKLDYNKSYHLVYEHGDFTEWNIISNNTDVVLFDFEFFVYDGLEYMDLCCYYYSKELYIKHTNINEIINNVLKEIGKECFDIFVLFIINRIFVRQDFGFNYEIEEKIIDILLKDVK